NDDTFKNLRLGFIKGVYEEIISRASIFYYLQFEAYVGEIFGVDRATYWSLAIFRNCYMDLKELGFVVRDPKTKRADFGQFQYGRPTTFGDPKWKVSFFNCALSNWLYGGDPQWKMLFGMVLAQNTELATIVITDDVASGRYTQWKNFDSGSAIRASLVYSMLKTQMRNNVDMPRIGAGENPIFRLPEYGI
ncbi:MAG TPA: hypothetical protein VEP90_09905, partial [Methylomirabilota bacterium]|nr:hypothetical protein [Methylomirabilota bacterium]